MRRWALLFAVVLVPVLLFGQVTVTSGWASTPAPYVPGLLPGTPLLVTPEVNLGAVAPVPAGATNATGNMRAGATTAGNFPPPTSATQPLLQYASPYVVQYPAAQYPSVEVGAYPAAVPAASQPSGSAAGQLYFHFGAAQFASIYNISTSQPSESLGELARQWRQRKATLNARTFTNEDITRMDQKYGSPSGGLSAAAVTAGTATSTAPATTVPGAAAQPTTPQEQASAQYQPPAQSSPPQAAPGQATEESPQRSTKGQLPPSASMLPTLLLLGVGAVALGFLLRRRMQRRVGTGF